MVPVVMVLFCICKEGRRKRETKHSKVIPPRKAYGDNERVEKITSNGAKDGSMVILGVGVVVVAIEVVVSSYGDGDSGGGGGGGDSGEVGVGGGGRGGGGGGGDSDMHQIILPQLMVYCPSSHFHPFQHFTHLNFPFKKDQRQKASKEFFEDQVHQNMNKLLACYYFLESKKSEGQKSLSPLILPTTEPSSI
ncbi:hypothetical protein TEA_018996 [Camellia sinensis var. sinensis]|uniref:Uncharacterized protein n=1 Tax=Camellia sinensis var. sinensis TaxID=542762 RepID=A0A4S4F1C4_CAMSN|nr:hypothetical protein TEA_018996 [Camellia sinensis var. sinensis]